MDNTTEYELKKINNLQKLRDAEGEVFKSGYARKVQRGRQPILTDVEGRPLYGDFGFVSTPVFYRGNYYASVYQERPYVRFIVGETDLWMPCCFVIAKNSEENRGKDQSILYRDLNLETSLNRYPLNANRFIVPDGRYAFLPPTLDLLFNNDRPGANGTTHNGCITAGFNYFLRKGLPTSDPKDTFLNAIGSTLNPQKTGTEMREFLTEKLPHLDLDSNVNEAHLWDLITGQGGVIESGFNLIIFEAQLGTDSEQIKDIKLKTNIQNTFAGDKTSLILYKYDKHYEPVYHVCTDSNLLLERRFLALTGNESFLKLE